jgi:SAM-dependent methyltransferase
MTPTTIAGPEVVAALRAKQQQTWASGDYGAVAATIPLIAERLVDSADLQAGWSVLDVAGGTGNAAIAAARIGCDVTCTDYVPALLDRARERAAVEGLEIAVEVADAESLPYADGSFDAVVSAVGVMFAADHDAAAKEMLRVVRPGGTIALASWTPGGFVGGMLGVVSRHVTPPRGAVPATRWGTVEALDVLLGEGVEGIGHRLRTFTFRYRSADHFVQFFREKYGPTLKAFAALDEEGQRALRDDLVQLIGLHARTSGNGAVAIPATYLESVAIRTG